MRDMTLCVMLALAACLPLTVEGQQHTSESSLDWAGVYQGILPCADCEGIETTLRLSPDRTYELSTKYLGEPTTPLTRHSHPLFAKCIGYDACAEQAKEADVESPMSSEEPANAIRHTDCDPGAG